MKTKFRVWIAVGLLLLLALSCVSCGLMMEITQSGTATDLMDCVLGDRYEDAYRIFADNTVTEEEFLPVWRDLRTLCAGAESFELEQRSAKANTSNGQTTVEQTYLVRPDNGNSLTCRVLLDDEGKLLGLHFRDVTAFLAKTDRALPIANGILLAVSILFLGFRLWMLVDCLRRKMSRKPLWVLLILLGITFTVTVGDRFGLELGLSLVWDSLKVTADPFAYALITSASLPIGALLYLLLRKRLTLTTLPAPPTQPTQSEPSAEPPTPPVSETAGEGT